MCSIDITVFGDINVDSIAESRLDFPFSDLVENGVITWLPIADAPGGSGFNFARIAKERGYKVLLIGGIGNDYSGQWLQETLTSLGICSALSVSHSGATGRALIVRDRQDVRLLINNDKNANSELSPEDLHGRWEQVLGSRVVYVSGYCVRDPSVPRYRAMQLLLDELAHSKQNGAPLVVFDVVPHRIYETMSCKEFATLTSKADLLVSEVSTMRRFMRLGARSEIVDEDCARATLEALKSRYSNLALRFGKSGCDNELLWNGRSARELMYETGHSNAADPRGFGDRLTLDGLSGFFEFLPAGEEG